MPLAADGFKRRPVHLQHDEHIEYRTPLRVRVCSRKTCLGRRAAMNLSRTAEPVDGQPSLTAYRCPFADEHEPGAGEWHVGHGITMQTLQELAEYLRTKGAPTMPDQPQQSVPALRFADAVRRLGACARAAGLVVPAFRAPPRVPNVLRTVRRHEGGAVVAVVIHGRPFGDVLDDMVAGVLEVNDRALDDGLRAVLRDAVDSLGREP